MKVRSVLELGSGPFSTSLFLDRRVFPDLEKLTSYEDDLRWAALVAERVGTDPRLDFRVVESVSHSVPASSADASDNNRLIERLCRNLGLQLRYPRVYAHSDADPMVRS